MSRRHILYVAYGADDFVRGAAYSILSLWRQSARDYPVTVVTDRGGQLLRWLGLPSGLAGLTVLPLKADQIAQWRGKQGYVHRAKPLAIQWAARQVAAAGDLLLFVDSDTIFTDTPAPLFDAVAQGWVVLNTCEGGLRESRHRTRSHHKLYRASRCQAFTVRGRQRWLAPDLQIWNSGVIGLPHARLDVLAETAALIDPLYRAAPIQIAEQVALSAVLQDCGTPLRDSADVVFHYWDFKEFRYDLALFFDRYANASLDQLLLYWPEIDPVLRVQPKRDFQAQPKWKRQLLKTMGRTWRPMPYSWG